MLDVAACAECLIKGHTAFSGLSDAQRRAMIVLVALHDVGKLSESFRALIRDGKTGAPRHWQLSEYLLCDVLDETLTPLGTDGMGAKRTLRRGGRTSRPAARRASGNRFEKGQRRTAVGSGETAARQWVAELLILYPDASLENMTVGQAKALSWALSG